MGDPLPPPALGLALGRRRVDRFGLSGLHRNVLQHIIGPFAGAERQAGTDRLAVERQAGAPQHHRVRTDLTDQPLPSALPPRRHLAVAEA